MLASGCTGSLPNPGGAGDDGVSIPGGQGQGEGQGVPFPTVPAPGAPTPGQVGSTGSAGSGEIEDLEDIFDDSLGDFDKEIGQEQAGMSSGGMGSTGSAQRRETKDARASRRQSGGGKRVGVPSSKSGSQSDGIEGENQKNEGASGGQQQDGEAGSDGQDTGSEDFKGSTEKAKDAAATRPAHKIPEDVVANTSSEDRVAEQIREAAEAEDDPLIREALWEEYRRHTGIKNK